MARSPVAAGPRLAPLHERDGRVRRILLLTLAAGLAASRPAASQGRAARSVDAAFTQVLARNLDSAASLLQPVLDSTLHATPRDHAAALMLLGVIDFYHADDSATARDLRASLAYSMELRGEWLARLDSTLGAIWRHERGRAMCGQAARDPGLADLGDHPVVTEKPRILRGPTPHYPETLRRGGLGGRVLLAAVVDTAGQVEPGSIKILATPHDDFTREARRYLERAVFAPGRIGDRPVRVCVNVPVDFKIRGAP